MVSPNSKNDRIKLIGKSILFCLLFVVFLFLFSKLKPLFPLQYERLVYGILGTVAVVLTAWLFLRYDKKTFRDIGINWESKTLKRFLVGLLIGLVLSSLMILCLIALTGLQLKYTNTPVSTFLLWTLALIPLAFMEEMAFRAYPFILLQQATGTRIALLLIAILFALYHFIGGQSLASSFIGPGVWSFVFGLAMLMSGGISLPTGLHFGANLVLAAVGQHRQFDSLWTIEYSSSSTDLTRDHVELIGNSLQVILLIVMLLLMEWYTRRKSQAKHI